LQPGDQGAEPKKPAAPQVKHSYLSAVDEEQLKRELGAAAEKESDNPLEEIARQMREAQQHIARSDAGPGTQQLQRQIVDNLDRLIRQARKCSGQCRPGESQPQPSVRSSSPGTPSGKPGTPNNPNNKPPANSSSRPRASAAARKPDVAAMRAIMKRLWGMLPEREREQMLQSPVEEFPPDYELQIEDYFRRLSEEEGQK
jgi:hypothetical protein